MKINILELYAAALGVIFSKSGSVSIGGASGVTISAMDTNSNPVHFTFAMLVAAGKQYMATGSGSFTIGSTDITVTANK
jgi:hypothetical protein